MPKTTKRAQRMIQRVVDGEIFEFPEHNLNEFEFWFGNEETGRAAMYTIIDNKVNRILDTGMCGRQALVVHWTPLAVVMAEKCNAIHLGRTKEKQRLLLYGKRAWAAQRKR